MTSAETGRTLRALALQLGVVVQPSSLSVHSWRSLSWQARGALREEAWGVAEARNRLADAGAKVRRLPARAGDVAGAFVCPGGRRAALHLGFFDSSQRRDQR
jgi:hypothetical protein